MYIFVLRYKTEAFDAFDVFTYLWWRMVADDFRLNLWKVSCPYFKRMFDLKSQSSPHSIFSKLFSIS